MNKLCVLQNLKKVESDPYPHILIKEALPEQYHRELRNTLPDNILDQQETRDHHGKLTYHVKQMIDDGWPISNIWREFVEYHSSKEFAYKVFDAFDKWSRQLPITPNNITLQERHDPNSPIGNCFTDFSMVKHPPENNVSNRTPHLDNEKEIYAGLWYVKLPEDNSTGGGFNIHKAVDLSINKKREFDKPGSIVNTCPYESNNFVMFWNSKQAQHSVEPRKNAEHPRWSFNMIARYAGTKVWK
jgi:hypothetical protein